MEREREKVSNELICQIYCLYMIDLMDQVEEE